MLAIKMLSISLCLSTTRFGIISHGRSAVPKAKEATANGRKNAHLRDMTNFLQEEVAKLSVKVEDLNEAPNLARLTDICTCNTYKYESQISYHQHPPAI